MSIVDNQPARDGYALARKAMIDSQLRPSGVNAHFVLRRMGAVAREDFVPPHARGIAYMDRAVPLGPIDKRVDGSGNGADGGPAAGFAGGAGSGADPASARFLAAPVFHAMMLQEAAPRPTDNALVVDAGSGYLPELLRPLVASLAVMTPDEALAEAPAAPPTFSLILVDGAVQYLPPAIAARLAPGGRVLTGLVQGSVTRLAVARRSGEQLALLPLAELGVPILPQFARPQAWSF